MDHSRHRISGELSGLEQRARTAPVLDAKAERQLLTAAQNGDKRAVERLVLSHMRVVLFVARRYRRIGIAGEDLVSEGVMGLLEAIRRFDLSRENGFATYATFWVRARIRRYAQLDRHLVAPPSTRAARAVLRGFERTSRALAQSNGGTAPRSAIAAALGVTEEDVAMVEPVLRGRDAHFGLTEEGGLSEPVAHDPSPEQEASERELDMRRRISLSRAMDVLSPRERFVVERRLLDEDAVPLAALGTELGVSRERVRQLQTRAQLKLRSNLAEASCWD